MKLSWSWLKEYTTLSVSPETAAERLTMAGLEVKKLEKAGDDYVLETEITSNRPDWLSHIGVARELSALFGRPFKIPKLTQLKRVKTNASITVHTPDKNLCPYYSGTIIEDIEMVVTPAWMKKRLEVCGLRSINFIVDVTNYVLLESGQPLHAFDLRKLNGTRITARKAKPNESIHAINGSVYKLEPSDCVIADEVKPVAIGGVMGGLDAEVSENTRHLLIESAYFAPCTIRQTSRRLKLSSDSSYRFERGVDPLGVEWARERAVSLIAGSCKHSAVSFTLKSGLLAPKPKKVILESSDISKTLGIEIPPAKSKKILNSLGFVANQRDRKVVCDIPTFRSDVNQPVDLIEEIARVYGYDKIPETLPKISMIEPEQNRLLEIQEKCRDRCVGLGLQEVVTFSVNDPESVRRINQDESGWVRIDNPRNKQLTLMRPNFVASLLQVIRHNFNSGVPSIAIFEIGNRYWKSNGELPVEDRTLAIAFAGEAPLHWMNKTREFTFYHLKGALSYILSKSAPDYQSVLIQSHSYYLPGEAFEISHGSKKIGEFGTINPQHLKTFDIEKPIYFGELSLGELSKLSEIKKNVRELEKHPSTRRDLSLLVEDKVYSEELIGVIKSLGKNLIRQVDVFDLYRGGNIEKGKKSVSFRITYQANDRTLQADEVNALHFSIVDSLSNQFSAKLH